MFQLEKVAFEICEMIQLHYFHTTRKESLVFDHPNLEEF